MAGVQGPDEAGEVASAVYAASSRLFLRCTAGSIFQSQPAPTALADAAATLTSAQVLTGILTITPSVARVLTLPTATLLVRNIPGCEAGDCIDFHIINAATTEDFIATIAVGTGGTLVGIGIVEGPVAAYQKSGSATFRIRVTSTSTPAYTCYRLV